MNFYNENNKKAAAWLRQLIADRLIPDGIVDERSIVDVRPADLVEFSQLHFFAGIAGWSRALELAGWPADRPCVSASLPCQPFSAAGKQLGHADERHLWPVFLDLVRGCRHLEPFQQLFGEQVEAAVRLGWLDGVFADLAGEGYACGNSVLGAHSAGAPHIRQRIFWGAYRVEFANGKRECSKSEFSGGPESEQRGVGGDDRMADANKSEFRRQPSAGEQSVHEQSSGVGGLANPTGEQADASDARGLHTESCGCGGNCGGVAEPESEQRNGSLQSRRGRDGFTNGSANDASAGKSESRGSGSAVGVGDTDEPRSQGWEFGGNGADQRIAGAAGMGHWDGCELIQCADGKARRVKSPLLTLVDGISEAVDRIRAGGSIESESAEIQAAIRDSREAAFPLASKQEHRVDLLRGYGNAIVPPVAAVFIQAFMESKREIQSGALPPHSISK